MSRLLRELRSGRVLLMDGAMGTELQRAGIGDGKCYELWNLTHPERVKAIHQAYVDAGARCLLTNTFQANTALEKHGMQKRLREINHAGVELARSAASEDGFVIADIGPATTTSADHVSFIRSLCPDVLLFETCSNLAWATAAYLDRSQAMEKDPTPIFLSMTYGRNASGEICTCVGESRENRPPEHYAEMASKMGVDALGVNCGREIGMDEIIEIIRRYRRVTNLPLFARPNAGTPKRVGDRWEYPQTPERMAARLPELLEVGVSMVGGCCGTTPAHIAAFRSVIEAWSLQKSS
jgi:5-methyltetrahydrofolate--homocysteine methyltransferase